MKNSKIAVGLCAECEELRKENSRLCSLLATHGIASDKAALDEPPSQSAPPLNNQEPHQLSLAKKIVLFRRLFRGRTDVFPLRWESAKGRSGYSPACGNEWKTGICRKPKIKCGDCDQRLLLPVTDQVIYDHLAGLHTIGVYPVLADDTCYFLAADFDDADWREDAQAFMQTCRELDIPAALEISRSGQGTLSLPRRFQPARPGNSARH